MLVISLGVMALGILIIFVGFSLRKKGKTSFIAGNNEVFVPKNEKKLAERIGLVIILFGIETVLFLVFFQLIKGIEGYHFAILALIHILVVFVLMFFDQMEM
ncbi:hypothetical protein M3612_24995 [Niallia taxi]|uniref:hypothetical protein n=1 Tax=Niallia taxi TaxID=2499688 RepID=UPI00203E1BF4|nr:hypothetical protein [Niallia taxi]MCM3217730.1 hypothetical protein [Niallia taxi]